MFKIITDTELKYKPNDYETKLIILCALHDLKKSPTYQILNQVVYAGADISYFEMQPYLDDLIEMGSVEEFSIDESKVYTATDTGEEAYEFFSQRIPASVREKIKNAAEDVNGDKSAGNKIYADYIPINAEEEYKVVCGVLENNIKIVHFEMYVGPKERAKNICRYFKTHTSEFYADLLSMLEKDAENKKSENEK